jgi:predicted methyltransferase
MNIRRLTTPGLVLVLGIAAISQAQEKSVKPGINDSFKNPNPKEFVERFEVESREVFAKRKEIVAACDVKPGQTVADIGAGTGLFTRLFSEKVGPEGKVVAVDIAPRFLDHIAKTSAELGQKNVTTQLCTADSTELMPATVDVAYICDVYHHFEFPTKSMTSLYQAMKPGGKVYLIDFKRIEGESSDFAIKHVRAGQEVFEAEIAAVGFEKVHEEKTLLKDNYFVVFEKPAK